MKFIRFHIKRLQTTILSKSLSILGANNAYEINLTLGTPAHMHVWSLNDFPAKTSLSSKGKINSGEFLVMRFGPRIS